MNLPGDEVSRGWNSLWEGWYCKRALFTHWQLGQKGEFWAKFIGFRTITPGSFNILILIFTYGLAINMGSLVLKMGIICPLTFPQLSQKEALWAQFGDFRTITQECDVKPHSIKKVWQSGNDYHSGDTSVFVFEQSFIWFRLLLGIHFSERLWCIEFWCLELI